MNAPGLLPKFAYVCLNLRELTKTNPLRGRSDAPPGRASADIDFFMHNSRFIKQ